MRTPLLPHPAHPPAGPFTVMVEAQLATVDKLVLVYEIAGPLEQLRIAPPEPARRADGLWRTTCCEAFIALEGAGYLETNFAPSSAWAAYRFDGYRAGMRAAETPAPEIAMSLGRDRLTMQVALELAGLKRPSPMRLGLSAVLEHDCGALSFWALAHPASQPDFHHRDGFALTLA